MDSFLKISVTALAFMFPILLTCAIKAQLKDTPGQDKYTVLSGLCFGALVFIIAVYYLPAYQG